MRSPRRFPAVSVVIVAVCSIASAIAIPRVSALPHPIQAGRSVDGPVGYELTFGPNAFAPSNAATATGGFIRQDQFIPASRCAECHETAHAQWQESAHRNSFREPFYQANVKHLIRDRGITATRHCESCHNPAALFSGALSANSKIDRPFDEEGVTCSVCHSIQSTTTRGIGSYVIADPALLVRADGTRIKQATNDDIWSDIESHRRAVMRPLLKTPEFCASCHKAAVVHELNGRKWLRSFAIYDEWQQSAFSTEAVQPLSRRDRQSCQNCHMPETDGLPSHRWPGANTAIPAHYGWKDQVDATTTLLKSGVVTVDVFALRAAGASEQRIVAPIDGGATASAGETVRVDVVVANRGVGHSFPAELRDIFEAWVEFEARDASGRVLAHSGAVRPDGTLEPEAHAYRTVPIATDGTPITKHDIWNTRAVALDRQIPAGRADVGCFDVVIPADALSPITLTATLNYRRFNRRFTDWVSREVPVSIAPVTEMARVSVDLPIANDSVSRQPTVTSAVPLFLRWRAYGVALFDMQQYEEAVAAFERALASAKRGSPEEIGANIDIAMTCLKLERIGNSQIVLDRARSALARALELDAANPRARFLSALLAIKQYRYGDAESELTSLCETHPRDRHVWSQLGALYLLQRRDAEAQAAYRRVVEIDPDDTEANMKLTSLYWRFGRVEPATRDQLLYQSRYADTVGESLRRAYLAAHPELYPTWPWRNFGDNPIGSQP